MDAWIDIVSWMEMCNDPLVLALPETFARQHACHPMDCLTQCLDSHMVPTQVSVACQQPERLCSTHISGWGRREEADGRAAEQEDGQVDR